MEQVQLEAFQANLHSGRILLQGPFEPGKYPPILEAIQNIREPFRRHILITSHPNNYTSTIKLSYETTFKISAPIDWSLALNYIQHLIGQSGNTPLLIVVEDLEVPDGFWSKLSGQSRITVVHFTAHHIKIRPGLAAIYDSIFVPFQSDLGAQATQHIFSILQGVFRATWNYAEFREILTEIRAAGAGLCWTRLGGGGNGAQGKSGNIFWYDPVHSIRTQQLDRDKIARILRWVAEEII